MRNVFDLANELNVRLRKSGIQFNSCGYPVFPQEMILSDPPEEIIPYYCRNQAQSPKEKTAICFYTYDDRIYPRLFKPDEDISVYREYKGVCGLDLSPMIEWDINRQKFNILLSQMATINLGLSGIKIIPNFRIGSLETINALNSYPRNSMFAVGALGCAKGNRLVEYNKAYLSIKLTYTLYPNLLIYGSLRKEYKQILDDFNVNYKVFPDFQRACRSRRNMI